MRSALPDLSLPDTDFSSVVLERARRLPAKPALIDADSGDRLTYGQLIDAIDSAAGGLVARGLRPGDVVAVCGANTPAHAVVPHAVWRAGGSSAPEKPASCWRAAPR